MEFSLFDFNKRQIYFNSCFYLKLKNNDQNINLIQKPNTDTSIISFFKLIENFLNSNLTSNYFRTLSSNHTNLEFFFKLFSNDTAVLFANLPNRILFERTYNRIKIELNSI